MKKIFGIVFLLGGIVSRCNKEVNFKEIVIDKDGPKDLWMKSTGDINGDGKTDLLAGGLESGGIVAYLAPGWTKKLV